MGKRGRRSTASLSIVPLGDLLARGRPKAPKELTPEQAVEWEAIVHRLPADWFPRESHGLLVEYCRHVIRARKIARLIERLERHRDVDIDEYSKFCKMGERESKSIALLATKMRISQHSTYSARKKKGTTASRPWED